MSPFIIIPLSFDIPSAFIGASFLTIPSFFISAERAGMLRADNRTRAKEIMNLLRVIDFSSMGADQDQRVVRPQSQDRAISSIWASRERRMCTARALRRAQGIKTLNPRMIWNRLRALFSSL